MPGEEKMLVCGTIESFDAEEAVCSKCGAIIWPTIGSLIRARKEQIPMICMGCFPKLKDATYGGVMHHGTVLRKADAAKFFDALEEYLKGKEQ